MKKYLTLLGLLVCFSAQADVCCTAGNEASCCPSGKKYCADEGACRTKCTDEICPAGYTYNTTLLKCEKNS